jgi:hypothetical protein
LVICSATLSSIIARAPVARPARFKTIMKTNSQPKFIARSPALLVIAALWLVSAMPTLCLAAQDVMLQTMNGKIVTGLVDDLTGMGTLGTRVYSGQFLTNFLASNPGFFGLRTGDASIPPGAAGFRSNHDINFDLLPMTIGSVWSNLYFWDGSDANGGTFDVSDVQFVIPAGISWNVLDDNSNWFSVNGTDQLVTGGVIDRTSADVWPDGIDSGAIHNHMALQLSDNDGNSGTSPAQGIYMIAWQARSSGYETSDPFFFVFRTSNITNAVRDLAVAWARANLDELTSPPVLPGDYNVDGSVDAADYVVWRATIGQTGPGLPADGNRDLSVDGSDYDIWKANFRKIATSPAEARSQQFAVPEAATLPMIAVMAVLLALGWAAGTSRRSIVIWAATGYIQPSGKSVLN